MSESLKDYWGKAQRAVPRSTVEEKREEEGASIPKKQEQKKQPVTIAESHPRWISVLVSVCVIVFLVAWIPGSTAPSYFLELPLVLLISAAAGFALWKVRSSSAFSMWAILGVCAGLVLILLSTLLSARPMFALFGDGASVPGAFLAGLFVLFLLLSALRLRMADILRALVIAGGILLFLSLFAFRLDVQWLPPQRAAETLGAMFVILLPLVWLRDHGDVTSRKTVLRRIVWSLAILLGLIEIGRQDFFAAASLMCIVIAVLEWRRGGSAARWAWSWAIAFAVLLAFLAFVVRPSHPELVLSHGESFSLAASAVAERPLFGYGPLHFDEVFTRFRSVGDISSGVWTLIPREASSFALTSVASYGVLFVTLLYAGAVFLWVVSARKKNVPRSARVAIPFLIGLSCVTSFSRAALFVLVVLLASLASTFRPRRRVRGSAMLALLILLTGISLYGGFLMIRYAVSDVLFARAFSAIQAAENPEEVRGDLKRAQSWYPWNAQVALTVAQHNAVTIALGAENADELADEAVAAIDQAVSLNGSSKIFQDAMVIMNDIQISSGRDLRETISSYATQAFEIDPRNPVLHLFDITQKAEQDHDEDALNAAEAFRENFNGSIDGLMLLAATYQSQGNAATDEEKLVIQANEKTVLEALLERDPDNTEVQARLQELDGGAETTE